MDAQQIIDTAFAEAEKKKVFSFENWIKQLSSFLAETPEMKYTANISDDKSIVRISQYTEHNQVARFRTEVATIYDGRLRRKLKQRFPKLQDYLNGDVQFPTKGNKNL